MAHETIDYFLEGIKTGKIISKAIKDTEGEIRDRKMKFDEVDVEICKILKEDSDYSLTAIQGMMSVVISVLAIYISCIDSIKDTIPFKECFLILPILALFYSLYEFYKIDRISKEGVRLRNKAIAALIQMQAEKNKKETGKDEKNS